MQTRSAAYSYFSIGGSTLDEIESELAKRGPRVRDSGRRHPGVTQMEFKSRIGFGEQGAAPGRFYDFPGDPVANGSGLRNNGRRPT